MKVCFVLPYAYPLLDPGAGGLFGGAEVYAVLFGRALARLPGFDVAFAVRDGGQPHHQRIDNVEVFGMRDDPHWGERLMNRLRRSIRAEPAFPWLRVDRWRFGLVWELPAAAACLLARAVRRWVYHHRFDNPARRRVLNEIGADVYAAVGTNHVTAEVISFCRRRGLHSVLFVMSDYDLLADYKHDSRFRNIYGESGHVCHFGLANADLIIAQTSRQQALLQDRFGRSSVLIRNPMDLTRLQPLSMDGPDEGFVLWIGKADNYKRPELCVELARRCPQMSFIMVMNRAQPEIFDAVLASKPDNVRVIEQVDFSQIEGFVERAAVVVNTSLYEGFPHVFLQAGKYGVPVVALEVDPDDILSSGRCGYCAGGDLGEMANEVTRICQGGDEEYSRNIRTYVEQYHDLARRAPDLAIALNKLVGGEAAERGLKSTLQ